MAQSERRIPSFALALITMCAPICAEKMAPLGISCDRCGIQTGNGPSSRQVSDPTSLALTAAVGAVMVLSCLLFLRQRRVSLQSDRLRKAYHLGEEVLGASSAEAILNRLCESLPGILRISTAHLYLYNRSATALESVADNRESSSISISSTPEGAQSGAVACFHYRTVIAIPDIDRSPFPIAGERQGLAKSLLFVPMQASGDVVGVLQLDHDKKTRS